MIFFKNETWFVTTTRVGFWTWIWLMRYCGLGPEVPCFFLVLEKLSMFRLTSLITLVILIWKWTSWEEKSYFKILGLFFFLWIELGLLHGLYWKNCLQENWNLDSYYEVFFCEAALYHYKFTICPCKEYCCDI